MKNRLWQRSVCSLILFLSILAAWGGTPDDIQAQIEEHKHWVETHVPLPDTLSTEQLLIETAKAIGTTSLEQRYIDIIRYAGEKFAILELVEYAQMRETKAIDKDESHACQCLKMMEKKAEATYGVAHYTTAFIRMYLVLTAREEEERTEWTDSFLAAATALHKKKASVKNEEIWLFAQLLSTLDPAAHGYENPLVYENHRRVSANIIKFYARTHIVSEIRARAYEFMSSYYSSLQMFGNYYQYVDKALYQEQDSVLQGRFSSSILTEDRIDTGEKYKGAPTLFEAALVIMRKVLHNSHPDIFPMELDWYMSVEPDTAGLNRVKQIRAFDIAYYGTSHRETVMATSVLRMQAMSPHLKTSDVGSFLSDLLNMRRSLSTTSSAYLTFVNDELATQIFGGNIQNALSLLQEMKEILDTKYGNNQLKRLSFLTIKAYMQLAGVPGYETALQDLVESYLNDCANENGFQAITIGLSLANIAATRFSDDKTALNLQLAVLQKLKKTVGEEHPLFFYNYLAYGQMAAQAFPLEAQTLDGKVDTDALFEDLIVKGKALDMEDVVYMAAGQYMWRSGKIKKSIEYFTQTLEALNKKPLPDYATQEELQTRRQDYAFIYANLLYSYLQGQSSSGEMIDFYGNKLIQTLEEIEYDPWGTADIYNALISYQMWKNNYQEAEALANECLAYYDAHPNQMNDGWYVRWVQTMIQIYGNNNEMDKCQQWAEKMERDLDPLKNVSNYGIYIDLLRTMYDMVEYKNPYDLALIFKYLKPLAEAIPKYYTLSNNNENILFDHVLYLVTKFMRFIRDEQMFRSKVNSAEEFEREWTPLREVAVNICLPELLSMKERMEQLYPENYKESPIYRQILWNLAIITHRCTDDQQQAEAYYLQLAQCDDLNGILILSRYYLETENFSAALQSFAHFEETVKARHQEHLFANQWADIHGCIHIAAYRVGGYEQALQAAEIYYTAIQERIKKNFDFYTQSERNAFISQYGAGGTPITRLLPHMSDQLAGRVYDILLREKGFLLRASARIHESILASGNEDLIRALDSLNIYQRQLQMLTIDYNQPESAQQAVELRTRCDQLERYITRASEPFRRKEEDIPTWEQVRNHLEEGEAAIEYVVTDSSTLALVLTPGITKPQCVPLLNIQEMLHLTQKLQNSDLASLTHQLYEEDEEHLYEKLWKPLEKYLAGAHTVYFSPTGFLNALAFHAFAIPDEGYLIDKYDLHQLTTTGWLVHRDRSQAAMSATKEAQIYGAIYYSEDQKVTKPSLVSSIRKEWQSSHRLMAQKRGAIQDSEAFPFLPNTLLECDAITQLLRECGFTTEEHIGLEPTEAEIRTLDGHSPNILHFSTHGFFFNDLNKAKTVPFFQQFNELGPMICTGLVLSGGEETWQGRNTELERGSQTHFKEDNLLSSDEVSTLNLDNTQLVVLSACETGQGSFFSEGVFGLQRGFKQAGVQSICASLWSVDDLSTSQLMQSFYRLWLSKYEGKNMQKAMREAMLEQRERTPSPYHWAPFVLYDATN